MITSRSPFFKKAISGEWQESADRHVKLPEDEPAIFKIYLHFLYTGELALLPVGFEVSEEHTKLAKLYVLAEKLQDGEAKRTVLQTFLLSSRVGGLFSKPYALGPELVHIVYEGTPQGSPMRRLIVDLYTYRAEKTWITKHAEEWEWPADFYKELALNLLDKRTACGDPTKTCDTSAYREETVTPNLLSKLTPSPTTT